MAKKSVSPIIECANDNVETLKRQDGFSKKYGMDGIKEHLNTMKTNTDKLIYLYNLKLEYTSKYPAYNEQLDSPFLAYWKKTIPEDINNLIDTYKELSKLEKTTNKRTKKSDVKFKDLFNSNYHDKINSFISWLIRNELISENNQLLNNPTNFARFYYLLKTKGIIKPNFSDTEGIKTFFAEFNRTVVEKKNHNFDTIEITRKTVTNDNAKSDVIYDSKNIAINNDNILKLFIP